MLYRPFYKSATQFILFALCYYLFFIPPLQSQNSISEPESLVERFLSALDNGDFKLSYSLINGSFWGSEMRFVSTTEGFGGITEVRIDTLILRAGIPSDYGSHIVYAKYFAKDPYNESKTYELDFHLANNEQGELKLVRTTQPHFKRLARQTVGLISETSREFVYAHNFDPVVYTVTFPYFLSPDHELDKTVNKKIADILMDSVGTASVITISDFFDQMNVQSSLYYEDIFEYNKELEYHEISRTVEIKDQVGPIVSIYFHIYEYAGGVHGLMNSFYYNYDLQDNKDWVSEDIFATLDSPELIEMIEYGLIDDLGASSLKELRLMLTSEIALDRAIVQIKPSGLYIGFNPYIIAPFGYGEVGATLSWEKVKPFLKQELIDKLKL